MPKHKPDPLILDGQIAGPSTRRNLSKDGPRFPTPLRNTFTNGRPGVKLDFASKGLTQVELKEVGKDEGPEARLHGTAMYSPTPGWPLNTANHSMEDAFGTVEFPVKVNFRVALTSLPEGEFTCAVCSCRKLSPVLAVTTLRRNTKTYIDLLDNGYDWHERFIGMWKVPEEGTWAISIYREAMSLPEYWAAKIRPGIDRMEVKWKASHGKRRKLDDPSSCRPVLKGSASFNQRYASFSGRWQDQSSGQQAEFVTSPTSALETDGSTSPKARRFDVSDLRQELMDVANSIGDVDTSNSVTSPSSEPKEDVTAEEATALAGGTSAPDETPEATPALPKAEGEKSAEQKKHVLPRHVRRKTSLEQEEADRAELEREWVHAVDILIQLADCLLVSAHRLLLDSDLRKRHARPSTSGDWP